MQKYPVDIDPEQIVLWAMAEHQKAPSALRILGRRTAEEREIPVQNKFHLGDEEREDLSEVATLATLEIAPAHAKDGWVLTVEVEDEIGPRASVKGETTSEDRDIDIGAFYHEFIRPGRGIASVTAEVEGPEAEARVTRLLNSIEVQEATAESLGAATGKRPALRRRPRKSP